MQEGRALGAVVIVERLERIKAHEAKPAVHALASNGGSAIVLLTMRRIAAINDLLFTNGIYQCRSAFTTLFLWLLVIVVSP